MTEYNVGKLKLIDSHNPYAALELLDEELVDSTPEKATSASIAPANPTSGTMSK